MAHVRQEAALARVSRFGYQLRLGEFRRSSLNKALKMLPIVFEFLLCQFSFSNIFHLRDHADHLTLVVAE